MTTVDIAEMPVAEKLQLMEALWDSLSARSGESMDSPAWHQAELAERLHRLDSGEEPVAAWTEAKERLRAQVKAG
jgi:putative addiction module component (TIGR02574 family)